MTRTLLWPAVLALGLIASVAQAQDQLTTTITINGLVAPRCSARAASGGGQTIAQTIDLGELAGTNGQLDPALAVANVRQQTFSVFCNTAAPKVTMSATQLATGATPPTGYANAIDYTADVEVTQASGTPPDITYTTGSPPPAPTAVSLTAPLANQDGNVQVTIGTLTTDPANALLVPGTYQGLVTIIVSPS